MTLKIKKGTSFTPLKIFLKAFILELKDSASALVVRLTKKLRIVPLWFLIDSAAVTKQGKSYCFIFSNQLSKLCESVEGSAKTALILETSLR